MNFVVTYCYAPSPHIIYVETRESFTTVSNRLMSLLVSYRVPFLSVHIKVCLIAILRLVPTKPETLKFIVLMFLFLLFLFIFFTSFFFKITIFSSHVTPSFIKEVHLHLSKIRWYWYEVRIAINKSRLC